jgi:4-hydroxy-tetrahydrodipicolinate synthase
LTGAAHRSGKNDEEATMIVRKIPFLKGAFTPLVVPFKNGFVDYERYAELIEWQIEQGTHGLLVNATSGEPTTLTQDEKARLIEVAVKTSAGRRPVAAGIPSESHAEAVALLARAEKAGADAVVSVTPYYARPPQRGLVAFFTDLAERTELLSYLSYSGACCGVGRRRNLRGDRRALSEFRRFEEHR